LKDDVYNQSIVSGMSWEEQSKVAEDFLGPKNLQKEINARDKVKNDAKTKMENEIIKKY
jgi:hypothetical protein